MNIGLLKIYETTYGYDLKKLKKRIRKMRPMKTVNHLLVSKALGLLNIMPYQPEYVWIARLYVCLPLPDGWEADEKTTSEIDTYRQIYSNES